MDAPLRQTVAQLLMEHPEWSRNLRAMVEWEAAHPVKGEDDQYSGFDWETVNTAPSIMSALLSHGVLRMIWKSRGAGKVCRLASLEETRAGLEATGQTTAGDMPAAPDGVMSIEGIFALVAGHERAKGLLRLALGAEEPIHLVMEGPPGTAKTTLLSEIGKLPGGSLWTGSTTTRAGLVDFLLQVRPELLVIDELEWMAPADQSPLLNLMEGGLVTRLQHGRQERLQLRTKVFAGANDLRKVPPAILSRFTVLRFRAYTPQEFILAARQALQNKFPWCGPEQSLVVANAVVAHSCDVRDAIKVARFAGRRVGDRMGVTPDSVAEVVDYLWPPLEGKVSPMVRREVR